jgi:thymidylate synthase
MNNLDKQYQELLQDILDNGVKKEDRTGTGTVSVFGRQIRHKMSDGFPLLTTKKMYMKGIVTELIWFLRGDTNIKYLVNNDCHIWDGDAYKSYLSKWSYKKYPNDGSVVNVEPIKVEPHTKEQFIYRIKTNNEFAKKWGELGPIYGKQWRDWKYIKEGGYLLKNGNEDKGTTTKYIDQIANLINDLKTNPDSRRLMVSAWNVGELDQMTLPPCHYGFQVYTRELSLEERVQYLYYKTDLSMIYLIQPTEEQLNKENIPTRAISLMWNQRSCDFPLGIPYNIASYAILLEIIGKMVNMVPDELIGNLGDCHIYSNQVEGCKEQITREPYKLPKLVISNQVNFNEGIDELLNSCLITDFKIDGYQSHPTIKFPLSN